MTSSTDSQTPFSSSSSSSHEQGARPVTALEVSQMLQSFATHQTNTMQQMLARFAAQMSPVSSSAPSAAASTAQQHNPNHVSGPASAFPLPSKVKISPPSNFTGNNNDINVDSWLFEMVQYLDTTGVADHQRINVVRNYLKQGALQWWFSQSKLPTCPTTWDQFAEAIKVRFQPVEAGRVARSQLRSISQGKSSVTEYTNRFQSLLNRIPDMAEADQIEYFINGLRPNIQRDVVIQDPKTLQDAMIKSQKLDLLLQQGRLNGNEFSSSSFARSNESSNSQQPFSSSSSSSFSSSTSAPMELGNLNCTTDGEEKAAESAFFDQEYERYLIEGDDYEAPGTQQEAEQQDSSAVQLQAMQQRPNHPRHAPQLTREEFTRCINQGLCLRCKKPGHVARNCDLPPRHPPQSRSRFPHRSNYQNSRRGVALPRRNFD